MAARHNKEQQSLNGMIDNSGTVHDYVGDLDTATDTFSDTRFEEVSRPSSMGSKVQIEVLHTCSPVLGAPRDIPKT